MRSASILLTIIAALLILSPVAYSQVCGEVTGDASVNIGDMVYILAYVGSNGPPPVNMADAELDNRDGITIGDAITLADYFFWSHVPELLTCGVTDTYSYGPAPNDTIYLPRIMNIPDGVDEVVMPVICAFASDTRGLYLPVLNHTDGSNGLFEVDQVIGAPYCGCWFLNGGSPPDTTIMLGIDQYLDGFGGERELFNLRYTRVAAGSGAIVTGIADRNSLWQFAVEKDGDLYKPVIVSYDYVLPPDTLLVSESDLSFTTYAGEPSLESYDVEFTSSGLPITFNVVPSDDWILLDEQGFPIGIDLVTPVTVTVTVNTAITPIGVHAGYVDIETAGDPPHWPSILDQINVNLTVKEPLNYLPGDVTCDGIIDIADLTKIIAYLYMNGPPLGPCE